MCKPFINNNITTLEGAPKTADGIVCYQNKIISTYSGDVDMDISNNILISMSNLPMPIQIVFDETFEMIKPIIKYQRYFSIWNEDLSLNEDNFVELLADIRDGLQ